MPINIDIILPTKNGGSLLKTAVRSILRQSYPHFKLWIVDDHSTDNSLQYIPTDPRIQIIFNQGKGLVDALNTGIRKIQSPWVVRMDGDDISHPKRLEKQLHFALKYNLDWVSCLVQNIPFSEKHLGFENYIKWHNQLIISQEIHLKRYIECPLIHPTWFMKREIFSSTLYLKGHFPEDYEFLLRNMEKWKFGKVNEVLYYWRDSPNRVSRVHKNFTEKGFIHAKAMHFTPQSQAPLVIWGGGTSGKALFWELTKKGIQIQAIIDVDPKKKGQKIGSKPYLSLDQFWQITPVPFILIAIKQRGQREATSQLLIRKGLVEGKDYLFFN